MKEEPAEYVTKIRSIFDGSIFCELESLSQKVSAENPAESE
jgi:hypothetical protein